jgi:hypothetical protein
LPDSQRQRLESGYLREVGAFARDLFFEVSFEMSPNTGWQPRATKGYPARLDFLDDIRPDGQPAGPGDVVLLQTGIPYGMTNPEEDEATAFAAYGVIADFQNVPKFVPVIPRKEQSETTKAVTNWALSARQRKSPAPSIVPYLKVIWLEWFSQAFEPLKNSALAARDFIYRPLAITGLTGYEKVNSLKKDPSITTHQLVILDEFIQLRTYLETNYAEHNLKQKAIGDRPLKS